MKVFFYCGCYKKLTSLINEPEECEASGEIEIDDEDWKDECACILCPSCGVELHQSMDHFSEVKK